MYICKKKSNYNFHIYFKVKKKNPDVCVCLIITAMLQNTETGLTTEKPVSRKFRDTTSLGKAVTTTAEYYLYTHDRTLGLQVITAATVYEM